MSNKASSSLRKAAILIQSLDAVTGAALLAQMEPIEAKRVRREIGALGTVDPTEQSAVIDEFFRIGPIPSAEFQTNMGPAERGLDHLPSGMDELQLGDAAVVKSSTLRQTNKHSQLGIVPDRFHPGIELDGPAIEQLAYSTRLGAGGNDAMHPFDFLLDESVDIVLQVLEHEHPQAVALVISRLPPDRAAEIISRLSGSTQAEVVRRLVEMDDTDPTVLDEVAAALRSWLQRFRSRRTGPGGFKALSAILSAADDSAKQRILGSLSRHDRLLAGKLSQQHVSLAALEQLSDEAWSTLMRNVEFDLLAVALAGNEQLVARICNVRPTVARRFESAWVALGPLSTGEIDSAQRKLVDQAAKLQLLTSTSEQLHAVA